MPADIISFLFLAAAIFAFVIFMGAFMQREHFKDLANAEKELDWLPVTTFTKLPNAGRIKKIELVCGNCVIGPSLYNLMLRLPAMIFGGEVKDYAKVAERARRQAIVRMKKQADAAGADLILNFKTETVQMLITQNKNQQIYAIQVMAYGTAVTY